MWPLLVVVSPPLLDDDLRFFKGVEYLSVQKLIAEPGVEALAVSILPRRAWFDVGSLCADRFDPLPDGFRDKLWSIARPDECRNASDDEQVRQRVDHVRRVQFAFHPDRQTLTAELIDDDQCSVCPAVFRSMMDEVI